MRCRVALILALTVSSLMAEAIMTRDEIVTCKVSRIDSLFVRTSLPSGGIRVFNRKDVLVVRVDDQARLDSLATVAPELKFVLEKPAPVDTLTVSGEPQSGGPKRDPIDRGAVILRGALGLSTAAQYTTFSLSPKVTYFVTRGFGLGLDLSVASTSTGSTSAMTASFGPSALLAFGSKGATTFFTLGAGYGLVGMGSLSGSEVQLSVGLLPVFKKCLAMPIQGSLVRTTVSVGGTQTSSTVFQLGVGFGAAVF